MRGDRPDGAPVGNGLVHGQVEPLVALLGLGAVERAAAAGSGQAPARRALPGFVVRTFLVQQHFDPRVRGGLERLLPARRGALAAAGTFLPARDELGLLLAHAPLRGSGSSARAGRSETHAHRRASSRPARPSSRGGEQSSSSARISSSETMITFGAAIRLTRRSISAATSRRCSPTSFSMCRWNRDCDQPPWSWRPGTSSVRSATSSSRPAWQPEEVTPLTADDSDERTVAAAHERHERRKVELASDVDAIRHGLDQRSRPPHVVEARREHREAARAVAVELVREPLADSLEVLSQPDALVVRQAAVVLRASGARRRSAGRSSAWRRRRRSAPCSGRGRHRG